MLVDFFVFLHRHRAALRARLVGELGRDPTRAEALRRYHHACAHMCVVRAHARRGAARLPLRALVCERKCIAHNSAERHDERPL